jgi:hypothetical protein
VSAGQGLVQLPPVSVLADRVATFADLAERVADTDLIPRQFRGKPAAVLAAMLRGAEVGLDPFQSLSAIHVIEGTAALTPEAMRAVVLAHGHRIVCRQSGPDMVEVWGKRADSGDERAVTWTMADATRAGLQNKETWKKYPQAMLEARATAALCRSLFPDVIRGLSYTPEEVQSLDADSWEAPQAELVKSADAKRFLIDTAEAVGMSHTEAKLEAARLWDARGSVAIARDELHRLAALIGPAPEYPDAVRDTEPEAVAGPGE